MLFEKLLRHARFVDAPPQLSAAAGHQLASCMRALASPSCRGVASIPVLPVFEGQPWPIQSC